MSIQALRNVINEPSTWNHATIPRVQIEAAIAEYDRLREVVDAADKYDNGGSYPALRRALNKWRKAKAATDEQQEKEGKE